jgi:hypothetical protein
MHDPSDRLRLPLVPPDVLDDVAHVHEAVDRLVVDLWQPKPLLEQHRQVERVGAEVVSEFLVDGHLAEVAAEQLGVCRAPAPRGVDEVVRRRLLRAAAVGVIGSVRHGYAARLCGISMIPLDGCKYGGVPNASQLEPDRDLAEDSRPAQASGSKRLRGFLLTRRPLGRHPVA